MPTALITGASTGIGYELVKLFARDGYDLILVARTEETLQKVAAETGRPVQVIAVDLSEPGAAYRVFEKVEKQQTVDVLVNNAGFGSLGFFAKSDPAGQAGMLEVNVVALTLLTRLFLPGMIAQRRGRIMNVASTAAFQPGPLMAVYYATKAYVLSFSEAIRNEVRPHGITVTTLCPGPTYTEFQKRAGVAHTKLFATAMTAQAVAKIGYAGLLAGRAVVVPGLLNRMSAFLTRFAPRGLAANIARKLQETGMPGPSPTGRASG